MADQVAELDCPSRLTTASQLLQNLRGRITSAATDIFIELAVDATDCRKQISQLAAVAHTSAGS